MSEPADWCRCIHDLPKFFSNLDRAIGIMDWTQGKGYGRVTSGAKRQIKEASKHMGNIVSRCGVPIGFDTQRRLSDAGIGAPAEGARKARRVREEVVRAINERCRRDRDIRMGKKWGI